MQTEAENLTAYCGRFCGTCGISEFSIGASTVALKAVVRAAAFSREAEHLGWPLMRDLATQCCAKFEGDLDSFAALSRKIFPTSCRRGCVPPCEIAACCKGRGYATCAECGELDACAKLAEAARKNPAIKGNLRAIASEGLLSWSEAQLRAVRSGRKRLFVEAVERALG